MHAWQQNLRFRCCHGKVGAEHTALVIVGRWFCLRWYGAVQVLSRRPRMCLARSNSQQTGPIASGTPRLLQCCYSTLGCAPSFVVCIFICSHSKGAIQRFVLGLRTTYT